MTSSAPGYLGYDAPGTALAEKWAQAVDYYRQDLNSDYVRILLELAAHGYANAAMAERVRAVYPQAQRAAQLIAQLVLLRLLERE